jgi:hypothetical protein
MPEKKASKAASPPADAPMPTIGKLESDGTEFGVASNPGALVEASFASFLAVMIFSKRAWIQNTYSNNSTHCHILTAGFVLCEHWKMLA